MESHWVNGDRSYKKRASDGGSRAQARDIIRGEDVFPYVCPECSDLIYAIGRKREQGIVHHLDENPLNNDRQNLEVLHMRCHVKHHHTGHLKPGTGAAVRARMTGVPKSPETRRRLSESVRRAAAEGRIPGRPKKQKE